MNDSELRRQHDHALDVLAALGRVPRSWRRHTSFFVRCARRYAVTDNEIGQSLGMAEDEVRRVLAAGGE
ncbi:hypothetical protein [Nocardia wallacei]|uniref:hypothetical protein n=1 Tax=Nocardia wallacei TaxID=480035 RepID=UPI002453E638|nr:hypothetical protein [Nocardia wallacei]